MDTIGLIFRQVIEEGSMVLTTDSREEFVLKQAASGISVRNEDGMTFLIFEHYDNYQALTLDGAIDDVYQPNELFETICNDFLKM